jgi:hypothetical protein
VSGYKPNSTAWKQAYNNINTTQMWQGASGYYKNMNSTEVWGSVKNKAGAAYKSGKQWYVGDSGEALCEGHDYDKGQCAAVGCCIFEIKEEVETRKGDSKKSMKGSCWSAVGDEKCSSAGAVLLLSGLSVA